MDHAEWISHEQRINAEQVADASPLLDRLPVAFVDGLAPLDALALRCDPRAHLRARQQPPEDGDWLTWMLLTGRGWGKTHAAASWVVGRILAGDRGDYALVAPTLDDAWHLQWSAIRDVLPPWIRVVERVSRGRVLLPDQGVQLVMHSAEDSEYRGPNLRGAWCEEPVKWPRGEKLWANLRLAIRVRGDDPPRAVITTTPPETIDWILRLATEPTTRVTRGAMRDNAALDSRAVAAAYVSMAGTVAGARELDGRVVLGVDGALFRIADLDRARVRAAPELDAIVVAVDPAQSARRDADPVGIVAVGFSRGHLYVLESCSERLEPAAWARRAIEWCERHHAGRYVVENTGSGSYPRSTLLAQLQLGGGRMAPIVESPARGSKADRAQPLSAACASGALHLVGSHPDLERELTTWFPGARFSPGGLDALVHGASLLTKNWTAL